MRTSLLGMFVNLALALSKGIAGLAGHSFALVADALESLSDVVSGLVVYFGLKIAIKPPDADHPYGHGKAEPFAALVVGIFLVAAAVAIMVESIHEIRTPHPSYAGLVQATDGNFYGTTEYGGNDACEGGCWTVFKVSPSGTLTTLLAFTSSANPVAALIQATDGNLYGTTGVGGANNDCGGSPPGPIGCGMVFKASLSGTLTTLFSFDGTDGEAPQAALVQGRNGEFYGTTAGGGASVACADGCGTVFSLSVGLGSL